MSRKVTEIVEGIFLQRRRLENNFIKDTIEGFKDKKAQKDCMCNSLIYRGVQCVKCPLVFGITGCYYMMSLWLK